jgi:hypothetical protein
MDNQEEINKLIESLPPYPKDFMPWTEEDEERFKFEPSEESNINLKQKLFKVWVLWADLRSSKVVADMLNKAPDDKESDEFKAKGILVNIIDKLAKILNQTDLVKELLVDEK